jgi:hypothetical protein
MTHPLSFTMYADEKQFYSAVEDYIRTGYNSLEEERYRRVTFDRATVIRDSQADFFALGHPFVDAMIRRVGDYGFGGHTALRVIEAKGLGSPEPKVGYQFIFTVRSRVQREDGDEYLFDLHTIVALVDGGSDEKLAQVAASQFSADGDLSADACAPLAELEALGLDQAFQLAKAALEKRAQFWDWDEDVELIGVAKLVAIPE